MGLFVCLHKQLGAISRLRYLSESETFIILSCQRTYFPNLMQPMVPRVLRSHTHQWKHSMVLHVTSFHL